MSYYADWCSSLGTVVVISVTPCGGTPASPSGSPSIGDRQRPRPSGRWYRPFATGPHPWRTRAHRACDGCAGRRRDRRGHGSRQVESDHVTQRGWIEPARPLHQVLPAAVGASGPVWSGPIAVRMGRAVERVAVRARRDAAGLPGGSIRRRRSRRRGTGWTEWACCAAWRVRPAVNGGWSRASPARRVARSASSAALSPVPTWPMCRCPVPVPSGKPSRSAPMPPERRLPAGGPAADDGCTVRMFFTLIQSRLRRPGW